MRYLVAIMAVFVATAASAVEINLSGSIDSQQGYVSQRFPFTHKDASSGGDKLSEAAMVNDAKIRIDTILGEVKGIKFSSVISLKAATDATDNGDKNIISAEGGFGKLSIGTEDTACGCLSVGGDSIAVATGGIDGDYTDWINQNVAGSSTIEFGDVYFTSPSLPVSSSKVNKLFYETPSINGFQFSSSFVPDSDMKGTVNNFTGSTKKGDGYTDVIDLAAMYNKKYDRYAVEAYIGAQTGKAKITDSNQLRRDIRAFGVGTTIVRDNLSFGTSYIDWGKSGTVKNGNGKYGAKAYTVGFAYEYKDLQASLSYLNSKRAGGLETGFEHVNNYNKLQSISLGGDYKVAEGLGAYLELTHFQFRQKDNEVSNHGQVVLSGLKLKF